MDVWLIAAWAIMALLPAATVVALCSGQRIGLIPLTVLGGGAIAVLTDRHMLGSGDRLPLYVAAASAAFGLIGVVFDGWQKAQRLRLREMPPPSVTITVDDSPAGASRSSGRDFLDDQVVLRSGIAMPLAIRYEDASGRETERSIIAQQVTGWRQDDGPVQPEYVRAFCTLRNDIRTFRLDGILEAIDEETGEVLPDVTRALLDRRMERRSIQPVQQGAPELVVMRDDLRMLVALAVLTAGGGQRNRKVEIRELVGERRGPQVVPVLVRLKPGRNGEAEDIRLDRILKAVDRSTGMTISRLGEAILKRPRSE